MEPITNDIPNTIITGTAQADSITNNGGGENVTITSGAGNDTIENYGDNVSINGGADDDLITNLYGLSATINGGAGNDIVDNSGEKALINLGDGNNSVSNNTNSDDVTIKSGAGNDSISNVSANLLIQYGGGSDIIEGFNSTSTLQIMAGSIDNAVSDGVDAVFTIGDGSITLKDLSTINNINIINADGKFETFAIPIIIMGTEEPETISKDIDNATIQALGGNDTIYNSGASVAIYGGNGNDEIENSGDNVSIYGDAGDDSILSKGNVILIDGGDGLDTIENSGASVAIYGGNDNDSIKTDGDNVSISGGKGNDIIDNTGSYVTIDAGAGNDFIDNSGDNISIVAGKGNDTVTLNTSDGGNIFVYSSGDGNDKIYSLSENDTIKIVGNSNVKESVKSGENEYDIIFKIGTGSITLKDESYEKKVTLVDADNNPLLTDNIYTQEGIIRGNTIELSSALKETYQQGSEITFIDGSKLKTGIEIEGGYTDGGTILGGVGNDTIYGEDKFELTGGKGNDLFVYGGGSAVITDYSSKGTYGIDKISLSGGFDKVVRHEIDADNNLILIFDDDIEVTNKLTIENGGNREIIFAGDETSVNVHTDEGVLGARRKAISLPAATDNFSANVSKYSKLVTIDGSAAESAINIVGNNKANHIFAGVEGATLNGGKGNDKLYGNEYSGVDLFVYEKNSGRDTIYNYNYYYDESDRISLGSDVTIKDAYVKKDKDSVIKFKSGSITVDDARDVVFVQNGVETLLTEGVFLDKAASTAKTFGSFKGEINLNAYEDIKNVDASITKKAITIEGDFEDNYLTGGNGKDEITGHDGKDTLLGGKGNDTLWGGSDEDTFIYQAGSGTDYIMDYEDGELLQILDKKGKASTFKKAVFSEDTLTLTIKGGGKVIFSNVNTDTAFNINDKTYHVRGNTIR